MRVMVNTEFNTKEYAVIEIMYISYDGYKDNCLYMFDMGNETLVINGVSVSEANYICSKLYEYGYCDLRSYGVIEYLEEWKKRALINALFNILFD